MNLCIIILGCLIGGSMGWFSTFRKKPKFKVGDIIVRDNGESWDEHDRVYLRIEQVGKRRYRTSVFVSGNSFGLPNKWAPCTDLPIWMGSSYRKALRKF